ncbi:MAG: hypothetical protein IJO73_04360 [Clostridia bacterium]|nr:hypothetical protein [Clostridia bacterium]
MNKKVSINTDYMLEYLSKFDYIESKYGVKLAMDKNINKVYTYEQNQQKNSLQKIPPNYMEKTIESVYSFSTDTRIKSTKILHLVKQEVINKFLNIAGLEFLFNEHYFDFEWDMHWGMDFEKTSSEYYRDHFEHQIRNMYMMLVLLDDFDMISEVEKIYNSDSMSKVSEYVHKRFKEYCNVQINRSECYDIWCTCAKEYYLKKLKKTKCTLEDIKNALIECYAEYTDIDKCEFEKDVIGHIRNVSKKNFDASLSDKESKEIINKLIDKLNLDKMYFEKYSFRYILRSASIMAALFHDVSYPLCHFRKIQNRISVYLPSMSQFIHNSGIDFDRLFTTIQPSLLCMLVSPKELRKGLEVDGNGKYDHGVYSAVTFLLSFYDAGRIHDLSIDKQIAVELAALAIYNHNFGYKITEDSSGGKEASYFRPIFTQNPISFMLKFCDELQEWDRKYFELSDKEEHFFCSKCMYPIIKYRMNTSDYAWDTKYVCGCEDIKNYKSSSFSKREMFVVTTCKNLNFEKIDRKLIARINYEPFHLLRMAEIDPGYAKFRIKALVKLKKLLLNQKYCLNSGLDKIEHIYVDYIMTANPLYLKSKILQNYIIDIENDNENENENRAVLFSPVILGALHREILRFFGEDFDKCINKCQITVEKNNIKKTNEIFYKTLIDEFIKIKISGLFGSIVKSPQMDTFLGETIDSRLDSVVDEIVNSLIIETRRKFFENVVDKNHSKDIKRIIIRKFKISLYKYISAVLNHAFLGDMQKSDTLVEYFDFLNFNEIIFTKLMGKFRRKINAKERQELKSFWISEINKDPISNKIRLSFAKEALLLISQMFININFLLGIDGNFTHVLKDEIGAFLTQYIEQEQLNTDLDETTYEALTNYAIDRLVISIEQAYFKLTESLIKGCIVQENKNFKLKDVPEADLKEYIDNISDKILFYNKLAYYINLSEFEVYRDTEDVFLEKMLIESKSTNVDFMRIMNIMLKDVYKIMTDTISAKMKVDTARRERKYLDKYRTYDDKANINPKKMKNAFKEDDKFYNAVESYCNPLNWYSDGSAFREFSKFNIDFHSDLYLFELLHDRTKGC